MKNKKKKPIYKRWWFCLFSFLLFTTFLITAASVLGTLFEKGQTHSTSVSDVNSAREKDNVADTIQPPEDNEPDVITTPQYDEGTYLVGNDIQSGLYKVTIKPASIELGYVERASGLSMSFNDIIANGAFLGNGYVRIKEGDAAVKVTGAILEPVDLDTYDPIMRLRVTDGIYLVGYDISPGTYRVELEEGQFMELAYVERLSDVSMEFTDIIANEVFQGPGYVEIYDSDFAVTIRYGALMRIE